MHSQENHLVLHTSRYTARTSRTLKLSQTLVPPSDFHLLSSLLALSPLLLPFAL